MALRARHGALHRVHPSAAHAEPAGATHADAPLLPRGVLHRARFDENGSGSLGLRRNTGAGDSASPCGDALRRGDVAAPHVARLQALRRGRLGGVFGLEFSPEWTDEHLLSTVHRLSHPRPRRVGARPRAPRSSLALPARESVCGRDIGRVPRRHRVHGDRARRTPILAAVRARRAGRVDVSPCVRPPHGKPRATPAHRVGHRQAARSRRRASPRSTRWSFAERIARRCSSCSFSLRAACSHSASAGGSARSRVGGTMCR